MKYILISLLFLPFFCQAQNITTIAGTGTAGYTGEGGAATAARVNAPWGIAVDSVGNVYFSDAGNNRIRKISSTGTITLFAGTGAASHSGDGGAATAAGINFPTGVVVHGSDVYIAELGSSYIRKVNSSGIISTVAGVGINGSTGDGGQATNARISAPHGVAVDNAGNIYIPDENSATIRKVNTSGIITTIAGTGVSGYSGDGGPATLARLDLPNDVVVDASGNVYVAEWDNHIIRKINTSGIISTFAGTGTPGHTGDGGPATAARLNGAGGMYVNNATGNFYFFSTDSHRLRMVSPSGIITTVAGTGTGGFSGDGGAATAANLNRPNKVTGSIAGILYITDQGNQRVRKIGGCGSLPPITGTTTVCSGSTLSMTHTTSGGVWFSGATSIATIVPSTGVLSGVSPGTAAISYSTPAAGGCPAASVGTVVTVISFPDAGIIAGTDSVCIGSTATLSSTISGGTWISKNTAIATVVGGGLLRGVSAGTDTVWYVVSASCGADTAAFVLRVRSAPSAGTISGTTLLCSGSTTTLSSSTSGGTWSSAHTAIATVGTSGIVFGVSNGVAIISYTVTNFCGTSAITATVTVGTTTGSISGTSTVCIGSSSSLSTSLTGGTWSSSATSVATVGTSGIVSGVSIGSSTISYTVTGACGTSTATRVVGVVASPSISLGAMPTVCAGDTSASFSYSGSSVGLYYTITWDSTATANGFVGTQSIINTIIGNRSLGGTRSGDGGPATAAGLNNPMGISVDAAGNTYFSEVGFYLRKVNTSGVISTLAGNGSMGYSGDGGPATAAGVGSIGEVITDAAGNIYFVDASNYVVRKIDGAGIITTVAGNNSLGGGHSGDGGPATAAGISSIFGLAIDASGNLYFSDPVLHLVRKVNTSGIITTIAGDQYSGAGYGGDGGAATAAFLFQPHGLSADAAGNVYIADMGNSVIRKVTPSGIINTVAGDNSIGSTYSGDGGPATSAGLNIPYMVKTDNSGNLYIADAGNYVVRKVTTAGIINSIAGNNTVGGTFSGDGGPATAAGIASLLWMAVDGAGNIVLSDQTNHVIRKVYTSNILPVSPIVHPVPSTARVGLYLGTLTLSNGSCSATYSLSVTIAPTSGPISGSSSVCIGNSTVLSVPYTGGTWTSSNTAVATVGTSGVVTGVSLGTTTISYYLAGVCGPTTAIRIVTVVAAPALTFGPMPVVCVGDTTASFTFTGWSSGYSYILTWGDTATAAGFVGTSSIISTVVGNNSIGGTYSGDGGAATAAGLNGPTSAVFDASGNMYFTDMANGVVRKVTPGGVITTIAGDHSIAGTYAGDGGPATAAGFSDPSGLAFDASGNLFIADGFNHVIRKIAPSGIITTVAGVGTWGNTGDGGPATAAELGIPSNIAFDPTGNLYVADENVGVIRMINTAGIISTVVGNASSAYGYTGDGGPATAAGLFQPSGMVFDASGNLFFADRGNHVVRKVNTTGIISTVAGNNAIGGTFSGDGGSATAAGMNMVFGVTLDGLGNLFISDGYNSVVRKVSTTGIISTYAGNNSWGYSGDGGAATAAELSMPYGLTVGSDGSLYIADPNGYTIRKVSSSDSLPPSPLVVSIPDTASAGVYTGVITVSNGSCSATYSVSVTVSSGAGPISGGLIICSGGSTTLSVPVGGGTWTSSHFPIAMVDTVGVVTGMFAGSATITYTLAGSCGAGYDTAIVSVLFGSTVAGITGDTSICAGTTGTLSNSTPGGVWSSSNPTVATIGTAGVVTGLSAGTTTISYTVPCGSTIATKVLTVNPAPSAGSISGSSSVLVGSSITLSASVGGGSWTSSSSSATVIGGIVTGASAGTATISYSVTNSCGTAVATMPLAILTTTLSLAGWGTYFGGIYSDGVTAVVTDSSGNIYMAGQTGSPGAIATSGGHQTTLGGGWDGFLVKYNRAGVRQWSTYYGGSDADYAFSLAIDAAGNLYIAGTSRSAAAIATSGAHQTSNAGGADGYVAKFNNAGVRQWATYYGGAGDEIGGSVAVDAAGNVYLSGGTPSTTGIATSGAHQTSFAGNFDKYLVKFNSAGVRQWATFYGGIDGETDGSVAVDAAGNVYMSGNTSSNTTIATSGAHQTSYGGALDAFLVKFNSAGSRQWATYYGGSGLETSAGLSVDVNGDILLTGVTNSTTSIATSGSHQSSIGGANDAYVAKFNSAGVRQWGTYYGGTGSESGSSVKADAIGMVYVVGSTNSTASIATSGARQVANAGGDDAFLVQFNGAGVRRWGSYFGASANDGGSDVSIDPAGYLYIGGVTYSTSGIAILGADQFVHGGIVDGFLVSFSTLVSPIVGDTTLCIAETATLSNAFVGGTWASSNTAVASVGSSTGVVRGIAAGTATITYTTSSGTATVLVTVSAGAGAISGASMVCVGSSITLTNATSGGVWSSSALSVATIGSASGILRGVSTGTTTVSYALPGGCIATATITVNPVSTSGTISGPSSVCVGAPVTLTTTATGGSWSTVAHGNATVSASGVVFGTATGGATISYYAIGGCGSAAATHALSVLPAAVAGTITGMSRVAIGTTISLTTGGITGGTWSSSNTAVATMSGGIARGVSIGTSTISYTVANSCGADTALFTLTVYSDSMLPLGLGWATYYGGPGYEDVMAMKTDQAGNIYMVGKTASTSAIATSGAHQTTHAGGTYDAFLIKYNSAGVRQWSTYFGGSGSDDAMSLAIDASGDVYFVGTSASASGIATSSAHQTTAVSGNNAYLAKFNPSGVLQWATYYSYTGGSVKGYAVTTDATGNVFLGGQANVAGYSTSGSHQPSHSGGMDAFLVKFNSSGVRQWATYYGGTSNEVPYSLATDATGSVYMAGETYSSAGIASSGAHQTALSGTDQDGFLVKFDATGARQWGTYYGGPQLDYAQAVATDPSGDVYIGGLTIVAGSFATSGAHQGGFGGTVDAYLAKFSSAGVRQWGTYYGGTLSENCRSVTTDAFGNVFMTGITRSTTDIATSGAFQPSLAGAVDAYMVKFNSAGVRKLATYFGGPSNDNPEAVSVGSAGEIYIAGQTESTSGIASSTADQPVYGGAKDGFLARFNSGSGITGTPAVCAGATTSLSNATSGGTWSSSNTSVATVGTSTGVVTGVSSGTSIISYTTGSSSVVVTVTVTPAPGSISGSTSLCAGSTTTLSNATSGGAWSSSAVVVATVGSGSGVVAGVAAGTTTITYAMSLGCQATTVVTVNPSAASVAISGVTTVCTGATISLSTTGTGGTWSSSAASATVSSAGVVSGVSLGTTVISYTVTGSCGSAVATHTVAIITTPSAGTIAGATSVCTGSTISLSTTGTGGAWSSSSASATVSSAGVVSGVSAGVAVISYTTTNSCGSASATHTVTINTTFSAGVISGATTVCTGVTISLSTTGFGGAWSSSNANATVSSGGVVTGVSVGTSIISYSLSSSCGSSLATHTVAISLSPSAGTISGLALVAPGSTITLSASGTSGGSWTSSNAGVATVSGGVVGGASVGTATISYSVTNSCGTDIATHVVGVGTSTLGAISGPTSFCAGTSVTFSHATSGGVWASSAVSTATIGSSSGITGGIAGGSTIISYTVGASTVTTTVTVLAAPAAINGTAVVCVGGITTLSTTTTGGSWISSHPSVATASTSAYGIIGGVSGGTTTISYVSSAGCASMRTFTVSSLPSAISGPVALCLAQVTTYSNAATGGTWSSSNPSILSLAGSTGVATASGGTTGNPVITYTMPGGCRATLLVPVVNLGTAISGTSTLCVGSTSLLTHAVTIGAWSSSDVAIATTGTGSGLVYAVSPGTATISYSVNPGCQQTRVVTITASPSAITGAGGVCVGQQLSLSNAATGGAWSSSSTARVSVNSTSGVATGIAAGTATITYATGSCYATSTVTVFAVPSAISGPTAVCVGNTITLGATPSGGAWSSSDLLIATTSGSVVRGVSAGTSLISYTLSSGCARATTITVSSFPTPILGAGPLCLSQTTTLSNATTGGRWTSSTTVATVGSSSGIVTASASLSGYPVISYTMPGGCVATATVQVVNLAAITGGASSVCEGQSTLFYNSTAGGVWSSTGTSVATVGTNGRVTGVSAGATVISYAINAGCARSTSVTVNSAPGITTGAGSICVGTSITLSNPVSGGTWSSLTTSVATVGSSSGIVRGVSSSSTAVRIIYTIGSGCRDTALVTVDAVPTLSGPVSVCASKTITLGTSIAGGNWTSTDAAVATAHTTSGLVTGVSAGTVTISYAVGGGCAATRTITVNPYADITGPTLVCMGSVITLSNAITGGTWSSYYTSIASINASTGIVTPISGSGTVNTITYTMPGGCVDTSRLTVGHSAPITGPTSVCEGSTINLSNIYAGAGGTWSSSTTSVATITTPGAVVSGVAAGVTVITYLLPTGCLSTTSVTVSAAPDAITGPATVCRTATITLSSTTPGGVWTTLTSTTASVGSASGIVTGLAVSSTIPIITYTLPTGCFDTAIVRVTYCAKPQDGGSGSITGNGVATMRVVPNPNAGAFTISGQLDTTDDEQLTIEVTNMLGQVVYSGSTLAVAGTIDAQVQLGKNIANGMYLLTVRSVKEVRVFHIVVEQ